jgi:hypothetical protein
MTAETIVRDDTMVRRGDRSATGTADNKQGRMIQRCNTVAAGQDRGQQWWWERKGLRRGAEGMAQKVVA